MSQLPQSETDNFKAATRAQWDRSAEGWHRNGPIIRSWLREATDAMLRAAGIGPGMRVLDVAAGAGDQTLDIAGRVGASGHVLATDLSPAILEFAGANARSAGYRNVATQVADGESLKVAEASFDAAICRLGLMLFSDPAKGLSEMAQALKPGGQACTLVFSVPEKNPCVAILRMTALKHAGQPPGDPYQPGGLFSLGRPGLIDELFREAGFSSVTTTAISAPFRLASVDDYLDFVRSSASPILGLLARLGEAERAAAWAEIEDRLGAFTTPAGWEGPNELLLTTGRRP